MMFLRGLGLAAGLVCSLAAEAASQTQGNPWLTLAHRVHRGAPIVVVLRMGERISGTMGKVEGDFLLLLEGEGIARASRTLHRDGIASVTYRRDARPGVRMLIGGAIGVGVGLAAGEPAVAAGAGASGALIGLLTALLEGEEETIDLPTPSDQSNIRFSGFLPALAGAWGDISAPSSSHGVAGSR